MSQKEKHIAELLNAAGCNGPRGAYDAYFHYFNCQKFYEAHDVLEHLWLRERHGRDNNFFKALIQLAGAFVHLQKDRVKPAAALFRLSRSYLETYPMDYLELDVSYVIELINHWLQLLERYPENPLPQQQPPRLYLFSAIEPIPMSPPGYFADMSSKEEATWENEVGKASVVEPPEDDLE